ATNSVARLRNFAGRLKQGKFPTGSPAGFHQQVAEALLAFDGGLADDLNTAVALGAAFDLLREANTSIDSGQFGQEDAAAARRFLAAFDEIFAVLEDDDAAKLAELGFAAADGGLSEGDVEARIAERQAARQRRDFTRSDEIRKELAERGIILEDNKD